MKKYKKKSGKMKCELCGKKATKKANGMNLCSHCFKHEDYLGLGSYG